jgi:putative flippase GtrA
MRPNTLLTTVLSNTANRKEAKRFIKFSLVGALGAIIDFGVLNLLIFGLGLDTSIQKIIANIISTSVAIVSNFTWNRLWTFPESRSRKKRYQLVQFTLVNLIGLVINTGIFSLTDHFLYLPLLNSSTFFNGNSFLLAPFTPETLAIQLAKATAIGIVLFWNFGANRLWTYRGL